ncbi:hypothetical protein B0H16DRAFT_1470544 [Mycena metata]|uniref:Uncharacterized protein n=1 Tax=Mycena metata TaxID=1033252 RepID=A0AAD7MS54_9AGAR|nr:hypothetical protein B0H16DRAFT_1470544 [Mycena metata]
MAMDDADADDGEDDVRAIAVAGVDALGRVVSSSSSSAFTSTVRERAADASAVLKPEHSAAAEKSEGRQEECREQEERKEQEGAREEEGEPTESQLSRHTHVLERSALFNSILERQEEARERHAMSFAQDDGAKSGGKGTSFGFVSTRFASRVASCALPRAVTSPSLPLPCAHPCDPRLHPSFLPPSIRLLTLPPQTPLPWLPLPPPLYPPPPAPHKTRTPPQPSIPPTAPNNRRHPPPLPARGAAVDARPRRAGD